MPRHPITRPFRQASATISMKAARAGGTVAGITPVFLINGRPVLGAQPTATFKEAVEAAAKAAGL